MKLWIRSQDKTRLLECKDIRLEKILYTETNNNLTINVTSKVIGCNVLVNNIPLAKYDTLERALQVLDEIQKTLNLKIV